LSNRPLGEQNIQLYHYAPAIALHPLLLRACRHRSPRFVSLRLHCRPLAGHPESRGAGRLCQVTGPLDVVQLPTGQTAAFPLVLVYVEHQYRHLVVVRPPSHARLQLLELSLHLLHLALLQVFQTGGALGPSTLASSCASVGLDRVPCRRHVLILLRACVLLRVFVALGGVPELFQQCWPPLPVRGLSSLRSAGPRHRGQ
ncbi:hypothetical protein B484DRAFT_461541, partial [Ochromonadaceae sp. CCMP2298]